MHTPRAMDDAARLILDLERSFCMHHAGGLIRREKACIRDDYERHIGEMATLALERLKKGVADEEDGLWGT